MTNQAIKMTVTMLDLPESARQRKIAALAYEVWLARAFRSGSPAEDWLRAERKVRGRAGTIKLRRTTVGNFLVS
jgi:hypothetical protein